MPILSRQFWTLKYVDPATYQILGNLKIVTTGVLFRLLLQRRLSLLQWISLVLLMIGATTSQVPGSEQLAAFCWQQCCCRFQLRFTQMLQHTRLNRDCASPAQLKTGSGSEGRSLFAAPIEVGN